MPFYFRILQVVDWLIALAWMARVLEWRSQLHRVPDLTRTLFTTESVPRLSVIVPARNEEDSIAATLASLLASEGVDLEIIVVDDRSTDETGAIVDSLRDQVQVLHVSELPERWLGKTHAMALAAERATGEWLLFTDADILFAPDALRRALALAVSSHADHLVLLPTVLLRTWGERMMISFLQVLAIWAMRLWRVPNPRAQRDAIGVGAFNLLRRDVYEELGGWEALRMEVLEDLALGRRLKAEGFRQQVAFGVDLVGVRWASGALGVINNLTKNLFALFTFRPARVLGFTCGLCVFTLLPLLACLAGRSFWWPAVVQLVALGIAYQKTGKYHHFTAAQLSLFPLASFLLQYALLRSMVIALRAGGITWRGTFYPLNDLRR